MTEGYCPGCGKEVQDPYAQPTRRAVDRASQEDAVGRNWHVDCAEAALAELDEEPPEPTCDQCGKPATVIQLGVPVCQEHWEETEENLQAEADEAEEHLQKEREAGLARQWEEDR